MLYLELCFQHGSSQELIRVNVYKLNFCLFTTLREGILLGIGNPLLDITAIVDPEYLAQNDLKADNAIEAQPKHKHIFSEIQEKYKVAYTAGGSVQNSLRVLQWIVKKRNVALFFGCVGDDEYAKILEASVRADGVNVCYQKKKESETGKCAVLITTKHRSLVADLGAVGIYILVSSSNLSCILF